MAELPFSLAGHSGVTPRSVAAFTLAPARISRSALSTIVMIAGPMQRRGAVGFGGVDVHLFLDQSAQGVFVAVLGRVDQRRRPRSAPSARMRGDRRPKHSPVGSDVGNKCRIARSDQVLLKLDQKMPGHARDAHCRPPLNAGQRIDRKLAGAAADLLHRIIHLVHDGHQQVGRGGLVGDT